MKRPQRIMLCSETTSLEGVRQFYSLVEVAPHHLQATAGDAAAAVEGAAAGQGGRGGKVEEEDVDAVFALKVQGLIKLLSSLSFHQVGVCGIHQVVWNIAH